MVLRTLRRWHAARGAKSSLKAVKSSLRAKVMLQVDAGELITNPVTGGDVFAYQIDVGYVNEVPKVRRSSDVPAGDTTWEVSRPFWKHHEVTELPDVVLKSRDGIRVLMRAGSYRLRDDVTVEGEPLAPRHPFAERISPWPGHLLPAYRSLSLSEGQIVLFDTMLVAIAHGSSSAYRGDFSHGCTLEARPVTAEPLDVLDLVGHAGF